MTNTATTPTTTITADSQRMIDECLDHFDFDKVHRAMIALDWHWSTDRVHGVPEIWQLRQAARERLRDLVDYIDGDRDARTGSGGFYAVAGRGVLRLQFVVTEWESERPEAQS